MRVHDLRHGNATLLLAAGVPMRAIADQVGHASPALTASVYAHVQPDALRAAVGALDLAVSAARNRHNTTPADID
jgi:integrase